MANSSVLMGIGPRQCEANLLTTTIRDLRLSHGFSEELDEWPADTVAYLYDDQGEDGEGLAAVFVDIP